jgi:hypothetical protein
MRGEAAGEAVVAGGVVVGPVVVVREEISGMARRNQTTTAVAPTTASNEVTKGGRATAMAGTDRLQMVVTAHPASRLQEAWGFGSVCPQLEAAQMACHRQHQQVDSRHVRPCGLRQTPRAEARRLLQLLQMRRLFGLLAVAVDEADEAVGILQQAEEAVIVSRRPSQIAPGEPEPRQSGRRTPRRINKATAKVYHHHTLSTPDLLRRSATTGMTTVMVHSRQIQRDSTAASSQSVSVFPLFSLSTLSTLSLSLSYFDVHYTCFASVQ